jgi:hypothetical protein
MKNQDKFEDTEENKLEYTNIYTEYVYILEQMIEANLLAKFTSDQIEGFYSTFKDNLHKYEKLNPEVVDSLFAFIDFEKFKKNILMSKNFLDENYDRGNRTDLEKVSDISQNEALFNQLIKEDVNDPKYGWYKSLEQKDKDGYSAVVHQRPVEGKTLNVARCQSVTKNVKFETFYEVIKNYEKYQKLYDTHNSQVDFKMIQPLKIENGVYSQEIWSRSKMGAMCSDREALFRIEMREVAPGKWISIAGTFEKPEVPCDPNCVRMQYFKVSQIEQVGNDLHAIEFQSMDLQGYFPKALMNKL